jgi:hypothetical protein
MKQPKREARLPDILDYLQEIEKWTNGGYTDLKILSKDYPLLSKLLDPHQKNGVIEEIHVHRGLHVLYFNLIVSQFKTINELTSKLEKTVKEKADSTDKKITKISS